MTCPFLKEAQVKFCQTATVRKLIPLALAGKTEEKCASADFAGLPGLPDAPRGGGYSTGDHVRICGSR